MTDKPNTPKGFEPIISENPFGKAVGPLFEKVDDGGWVRGFRVEGKHTNRGGFSHGGVLMTFADIVMARAVMEVAELPFVTMQMNAQFTAPAKLGVWVEGRAHVSRRTKDLAFVSYEIVAEGVPVLVGTGIFKIL